MATAQNVAPSNQGKMYGEPGFVGEAINLNVVNADIRDILNYITEQYGVNFVIDKSVKQVPVTINVSNVPWNTAFDSILQSQELGVQVNGPILRVSEAKVLAEEGVIASQARENQLDTSPLYTEFIRLNYARATNTLGGESGSAGGFVGGQSSSSQAGGGGASSSADQGILGILSKRLSRRGAVEVDGRSNTLIITDVKENIESLRQLVFFLDQPAPQVEIEARIVVATRTFSRDLGFQLSAVLSDTTRGAGGIFSTLPGADNNSAVTTPTKPGAGFKFPEPNSNLGAAANTIIGLTTGVFGTARINALLTAGEQKGNVKTIATPRVTTLNNRPAEIESGQQIPIVTVQPGGAQGGGIVATTEYVPVPLRLAVTPQITNVGTVILQVVAENNSVPPNAGGTPAIATQRMKTEVMVPDGGTTVVGGALFDSESEIRDRTPGLSKIPLLGNLFKRKQIARNTNEIIFFITPRIYRPDYNGKPLTDNKVDNQPRSTRIVQPVPLGNPPSNSAPQNRVDSNRPAARPTPAAADNSTVKSGN